MRGPSVVAAVVAFVVLPILQACDEAESDELPTVVQSFVRAHPELQLDIKEAEVVPNWANGKRWRVRLVKGELVVFYEAQGEIVSIRRPDLSFVWQR